MYSRTLKGWQILNNFRVDRGKGWKTAVLIRTNVLALQFAPYRPISVSQTTILVVDIANVLGSAYRISLPTSSITRKTLYPIALKAKPVNEKLKCALTIFPKLHKSDRLCTIDFFASQASECILSATLTCGFMELCSDSFRHCQQIIEVTSASWNQ